jgi:hypothetical protein
MSRALFMIAVFKPWMSQWAYQLESNEGRVRLESLAFLVSKSQNK